MSKEYGSHVVRTIWQMSREQQLVGLTRGVIHIMEESSCHAQTQSHIPPGSHSTFPTQEVTNSHPWK